MKRYSRSKLSDEAHHRELTAVVARAWKTSAKLLVHHAEVDASRHYLTAAYPTMLANCVNNLGFSEETSFKLLIAARTARRNPEVLRLLADGRIYLDTVLMLAPHLTPESADELLWEATFKPKPEVRQMLAERFPGPEEAA